MFVEVRILVNLSEIVTGKSMRGFLRGFLDVNADYTMYWLCENSPLCIFCVLLCMLYLNKSLLEKWEVFHLRSGR